MLPMPESEVYEEMFSNAVNQYHPISLALVNVILLYRDKDRQQSPIHPRKHLCVISQLSVDEPLRRKNSPYLYEPLIR